MSLVALLVWLVLFCLAVWAVRKILAAFAIGDPIASIVQVVVVVIFVLWLVQSLGYLGGPTLRLQ